MIQNTFYLLPFLGSSPLWQREGLFHIMFVVPRMEVISWKVLMVQDSLFLPSYLHLERLSQYQE